MSSDWYPLAVRRDGPSDKHGYVGAPEPNQKRGLVVHSAVGSLAAALNQLDSETARVSWTFTNPKAGQLLQHYPVGTNVWANGNLVPNVAFAACEHEGGPPGNENEPLTDNQVDNLVRLILWLAETQAWPEMRRPRDSADMDAQLYEHREMGRFGSRPTACPSERIPWQTVLDRLKPAPFLPTARDVAFAGGAFATFMATGRPLGELHPYDQAVVRWMAGQV